MPDGESKLWVLRTPVGRFVECVTRFVDHDVVVEILSDGAIVIAHRFRSGTEAIAWANDMRTVWQGDDGALST